MTVLNITKYSALVKWTEIAAADRLGFLQGYRISYTDSSMKTSPGKSPLPEQSSSSESRKKSCIETIKSTELFMISVQIECSDLKGQLLVRFLML